jgi:hypothetical protein
MKTLLTKLFAKIGVDFKEYATGMIIFLVYFTIIAIVLIAAGTWVFDKIILYYYVVGFFISSVFNMVNPNNRIKNDKN